MATCVRAGLIGLAMVAVLTVAACNQQDPAPATTTALTTPSTSTSASPSSTTRADPHLSSAEAAVTNFSRIIDTLAADAQKSLDELATVSRGESLETARDLLTNQRRQGHTQTGTVSIGSLKAKPAGEGKITVDACLDVTKTDLLDKDGKSVVSKDRAPRVRYTYVVQQAKDGKFYVLQDKAVGTC